MPCSDVDMAIHGTGGIASQDNGNIEVSVG
jgi:hypothetical protein